MGKTLRELERERKRELAAASRFIERYGVGELPPKHRLETGEDAAPQRSEDKRRSGDEAQLQRWLVEYAHNVPAIGHQVEPQGIDTARRVAHVLSFLLPEHVDLLYERYAELRTLEAMAVDRCIRYQSLQDRLAVAEQDFRREFGRHFNDELEEE